MYRLKLLSYSLIVTLMLLFATTSMASEQLDVVNKQTCISYDISNQEVQDFKSYVKNQYNKPIQLNINIIQALLDFEKSVTSKIKTNDPCIVLKAIHLSEIIFNDVFEYSHWVEVISLRIEQKYNFKSTSKQTNYYIEFLKVFEQYWMYEVMERLEAAQFEDDWASLSILLRFGASALGIGAVKVRFLKSLLLKMIKKPQVQRLLLTRAAPLSVVSSSRHEDSPVQNKIDSLTQEQQLELLRSPLLIFEDSIDGDVRDYNLQVHSELENLNYKSVVQDLWTKTGSLITGISAGLIADLALSQSRFIPYLKNKYRIADKAIDIKKQKIKNKKPLLQRIKDTPKSLKALFEKTPKKPAQEKKSFSQKIKDTQLKAKVAQQKTTNFLKENFSKKGAIKVGKFIKGNWLNLVLSGTATYLVTEKAQERIDQFYLDLNNEDFRKGLNIKKEQLSSSNNNLEFYHRAIELNNFLAQYTNFQTLPIISKRISLTSYITELIGPSIFCHKLNAIPFYDYENGVAVLTESGVKSVHRKLSEEIEFLTTEMALTLDPMSNEIKKLNATLDIYTNEILPFINSFPFKEKHFVTLQIKNHLSLVKSLTKLSNNMNVLEASIMNTIASHSVTSFNPASEHQHIKNLFDDGLINSKDDKVFCEGLF